jgi:hypothetical protein
MAAEKTAEQIIELAQGFSLLVRVRWRIRQNRRADFHLG